MENRSNTITTELSEVWRTITSSSDSNEEFCILSVEAVRNSPKARFLYRSSLELHATEDAGALFDESI